MRRIYKILVAIGLSVTLLVATPQKTCEAQGMPTMDIANLLQNILGFLQDADLSGMLREVDDWTMKFEQYKEKIDKFKDFLSMMDLVSKGARYALEITQTTVFFLEQSEYMVQAAHWFAANGAPWSIASSASQCSKDFNAFYKALTEESELKTKFLDSFKTGTGSGNSSTLEILKAMDEYMNSFKDEFYTMVMHYRMEMGDQYTKYQQYKYALANGHFMSQRLFY